MLPNHHHHHNGVAACATSPPHPCFPGMRFLVLVKGLHQTFTRFFNLIWSYHALGWALPPDCSLPIPLSDDGARQYTRVCSPPPHDRLTQIGSLVIGQHPSNSGLCPRLLKLLFWELLYPESSFCAVVSFASACCCSNHGIA